MHQKRTQDRRIQKTEALLRGALAELVHEKPYDDIVVKEILHRANVGRSTFYTRFGDKDDLLRSCIDEILRSAPPADPERGAAKPHEAILRFSFPVFDHIEKHHQSGQAIAGLEGRRMVHEQLQHAIAELIENDVKAAVR